MRIMCVSVYVLYEVQCVVILRDAANANTDGDTKGMGKKMWSSFVSKYY